VRVGCAVIKLLCDQSLVRADEGGHVAPDLPSVGAIDGDGGFGDALDDGEHGGGRD
jgi:hypothetical protein